MLNKNLWCFIREFRRAEQVVLVGGPQGVEVHQLCEFIDPVFGRDSLTPVPRLLWGSFEFLDMTFFWLCFFSRRTFWASLCESSCSLVWCFVLTHTLAAGASVQGAALLVETQTHKPKYRQRNHQEQLRVQYLTQGHFNMQTGGVGDQISDLLINGQPALPPEPQHKLMSQENLIFFLYQCPSFMYLCWAEPPPKKRL